MESLIADFSAPLASFYFWNGNLALINAYAPFSDFPEITRVS